MICLFCQYKLRKVTLRKYKIVKKYTKILFAENEEEYTRYKIRTFTSRDRERTWRSQPSIQQMAKP